MWVGVLAQCAFAQLPPIDVGGEGYISDKYVFDEMKCLNDYVKAMNSDSAIEQRGMIAKLLEIGCAKKPPQYYRVSVAAIITKKIGEKTVRFCKVSGSLDALISFHGYVEYKDAPPLIRGIVPCESIVRLDKDSMDAAVKEGIERALKIEKDKEASEAAKP